MLESVRVCSTLGVCNPPGACGRRTLALVNAVDVRDSASGVGALAAKAGEQGEEHQSAGYAGKPA
jgi:hypothetical protein